MADKQARLRVKIEAILNFESAENESNSPDWILAHFLTDCLKAFDQAVNARDKWYGIAPTPGDPFAKRP